MHNPFHLFSDMLKQPPLIAAWVGVLVIVNMAGIAFWQADIAKWIVGIFAIQGGFMMALYAKYGYSRILGAAHILWFPLVAYLVLNLGNYSGALHTFVLAVIVVNSISLFLDTKDVIAFFKGDRS